MMQLNNDYQQDDFLRFLEDFLPGFSKNIRSVNTSGLPSIKKAHYLGESKSLGLQVFEFLFEGSPNKRVALTKDAFSVMRSHSTFRSLAVFHSPDNKDWRFSLMTVTPEPTEKGKVSLSYSNPKRLSFFLGQNAKINTPTKFLISKGKIVDFEDLKKRFSIEVVNKEFYKEISQAFTKLVGGLLKLPSTEDKSRANLEFAVRLIGRVIFCWFLREKKSLAGLALMPKELLSLEAARDNEDYYHKILEPIFFEVLNKQVKSRRDDFSKEPYSPVPYLNGGLFSPQEDDYYKRTNGDFQSQYHNTLIIPDDWFKDFFEILETYNFTIDENTSYDEELSIDPEMLGRIFENLLAEINPETGESARKSTGSYYTPRIIVNYMVDESLLLYLKEQTRIKEEKLRAIISYDLNDNSENPVTAEEKGKIIDALGKVKILDPACGSGAFPMGALQKIVFILQQTDPEGQMWFRKQIGSTSPEIKKVLEREFANKNFDYIRKLGIIRENIYGVDIQPIATEISRLRCFLTLVVDQKIDDSLENRGIEPLPNLDFKFVTANSLIGLPQLDNPKNQAQQTEMFDDREKINKLKSIRDQYFTASGIGREQLKSEFINAQDKLISQLVEEHGFVSLFKAELTQKLSSWEPFSHKSAGWFDPDWMFGIKEGFDVVIANPPYVNISNLNTKDREIYKKLFTVTKNKVDLYAFFIERGKQFLRQDGLLTYIVPHTWKATTSFSKLRELIFKNFELKTLVELDYGVFEATVRPVVIILQKHQIFDYSILVLNSEFAVINKLNVEEILKLPEFSLDTLSSSSDRLLFKRIEEQTIPLGEICKFTRGIKTSNDQRFIKKEKANGEYRKVIRGRNIDFYLYRWDGEYIWYKPDLMKDKVGSLPHNKELFEVPEKLILQRISAGLVGCYDSDKIYALDTCLVSNIQSLNKKYSLRFLLALINSRLLNFWYHKKFTLPTVSGYELHRLPIKTPHSQWSFIELVNEILSITKNSDYLENLSMRAKVREYEKQIDQLVYKLYGLTPEEIKVVEGNDNLS